MRFITFIDFTCFLFGTYGYDKNYQDKDDEKEFADIMKVALEQIGRKTGAERLGLSVINEKNKLF